jgi:hypothetical protein
VFLARVVDVAAAGGFLGVMDVDTEEEKVDDDDEDDKGGVVLQSSISIAADFEAALF